ncbi:Sua5/YciO/YrdC/YwlC family protein [Thiomicrospira sp. R3]|uniref:Sua5/YciO/YrdC/YwlC family protein n=1 Tax=Thiomicrospira sp. R3 TaxID=3035472 RepID=UPI00259B000C|nr:Sua5/YciO/YrdC/YwlC family protein [Thiomicrospira sp. R3]WFE69610.1 Sua5/YciO/YrdC/YwlC family protein [Thiomicrospira sp. R3]
MDEWVAIAKDKLKQGEVIAYPTEAVFGLGCDPFNQQAVERILSLKQRAVEKGLILVAAKPEAFVTLTQLYNQAWSQKVLDSWHNPMQAVTWLLPKTDSCPVWVSGQHDSVAVRVSHHPIVQALCGEGVLVSTSANPATLEPARSCQQVKDYFGDQVWCLNAELGGLAKPSQIWDALSGQRLR